jgi:hypothetical protein
MRPCPECGSSDREPHENHFTLIQVTTPTPTAAGQIVITENQQIAGYSCRLLICNNCGHVALFTTA